MRRKNRQYVCAGCGRIYYRCNRIAVWDGRNPGHRAGWHKTNDAYCLDCTPQKSVERILVIAATAVAPAVSPRSNVTPIRKRA